MTRFHHLLSGIVLLTLLLSVGIVTADERNNRADAAVALNGGVPVVSDLPLNLTITPKTLNLNSKGIFTVSVTLNNGSLTSKPVVSVEDSSLACEGAEMVSAGVSNKDGGTLIARFHRQDLEDVTNGTGVKIACSGTISVNGEMVSVDGSDTIRVIGEKKGLDKIISGLLRYLGLEKDDSALDEAVNSTLLGTLDPNSFRNIGQMKKALRTAETVVPEQTGEVSDHGQNQNAANNTAGNKDLRENNAGNGKEKNTLKENNAGNSGDNGNKGTNKGGDASNGKSNGKKNK